MSAPNKRPRVDPLQRIQEEGYIGYVEGGSEGQIVEVPIEDILDSPFQTREPIEVQDDEELAHFEQLVASIKETGVNPPLLVQYHPKLSGKYFLPAGGHGRRDAAREAGLLTVPVVLVEFTDEQVGLATAHENLARRNLSPIEEGLLYKKLMESKHWKTQEELAIRLNMKSRGRIKDCLALISYADDIQDMVRRRKGNSGLRAAGYLHRLDDPKLCIPLEEAMALRAPIIEQFLANVISTEGVKIAVELAISTKLAQREFEMNTSIHVEEEDSSSTNKRPAMTDTELDGQGKVVLQRFSRFERLIGERTPSQTQREMLQQLLERIQAILQRA